MQKRQTSDYVIALQRAIEYHCNDKLVPDNIANDCPHHAAMLNRHLTSKCSRPSNSCAHKNTFHSKMGGIICEDCGEYVEGG